jgi:hypothetical protein
MITVPPLDGRGLKGRAIFMSLCETQFMWISAQAGIQDVLKELD